MIDYKKIYESIEFYTNLGYSRIESPWVVSVESILVTLPNGQIPMILNDNQNGLVGSAEQSFIEMNKNGLLPFGQIQSVTPCFRDEKEDLYHQKWFIKNELIVTSEYGKLTKLQLESVISDAKSFFEKFVEKVEVVKTENGFDIEYNGIELGSYGKRKSKNFEWIYGTGCAEPRLSIAMNSKLK